MHLHWHRRDLRLADNPALQAGNADGTVPLFVFDPAVLQHAAPPRVAFLREALETLRSTYRDRGSDLLIARGEPSEIVPTIATALDADTVTWGTDYSGLARARDRTVANRLESRDIAWQSTHEAVLHEPGSITTNEGSPYQVFTYFGKKWHDRPKPAAAPPIDADRLSNPEPLDCSCIEDTLPSLDALGFAAPSSEIPTAGTAGARKRLESFCESDLYEYADRRDYPAAQATSRLSPHLKFGTIGIREVYERTEEAIADASTTSERDSIEEFQTQLAWREFYMQVLWDRPDVVEENFKSYEHPIEWRHDPGALEAWKQGETGFPIVDAGMRQLRKEAYMHNRVRMIVASFLTKDLLIDWREGYDWFREQLVDHETANDTGGWQWAASTGTDAQPYFRIFNPMSQGERYDPDATYIKRYVPELSQAPADVIHQWDECDEEERDRYAPDYPVPIVDHQERREAAIAMFERARDG